jgi:hypothetical protein
MGDYYKRVLATGASVVDSSSHHPCMNFEAATTDAIDLIAGHIVYLQLTWHRDRTTNIL